MQQDKTVRHRRRWSADEKRALLDAWQASGLSVWEFSRQKGLQKTCLWRWIRERGLNKSTTGSRPKTSVTFAPVHVRSVTDKSPSSTDRVVAEVMVRDVRLRVIDGADAVQIARLVKALTGGPAC